MHVVQVDTQKRPSPRTRPTRCHSRSPRRHCTRYEDLYPPRTDRRLVESPHLLVPGALGPPRPRSPPRCPVAPPWLVPASSYHERSARLDCNKKLSASRTQAPKERGRKDAQEDHVDGEERHEGGNDDGDRRQRRRLQEQSRERQGKRQRLKSRNVPFVSRSS